LRLAQYVKINVQEEPTAEATQMHDGGGL